MKYESVRASLFFQLNYLHEVDDGKTKTEKYVFYRYHIQDTIFCCLSFLLVQHRYTNSHTALDTIEFSSCTQTAKVCFPTGHVLSVSLNIRNKSPIESSRT